MANVSRFVFKLIGNQEEFRVTEFHGQEGLSTPFEWQITVACEDANLKLSDLLNHSALLTLLGDTPKPTTRLVHGFVTRATYLETGTRFSLYRLTLTPQFSYFSYRSGHRIFQDMSVKDIINQLFSDAKIPGDQYQWKLKKSYPKRTYCVQYDETEFDFISRLLAEEGIHYHFTHHLDRHVMVLSDNNNAFPANSNAASLPYRQEQSRAHGESSVYQFEHNHKITASQATLIDFDFESPKSPLKGNSGSLANHVVQYPGKYKKTPQGKNSHQAFTGIFGSGFDNRLSSAHQPGRDRGDQGS